MPRKPEEHELIYLAGYFDGEGCVSITSHGSMPQLTVTVQTSDKAILELFAECFGGRIRTINYRADKPCKRQMYSWERYSSNGQIVLEALLPWLRGKKEQATLALKMNYGLPRIKLVKEEWVNRLEILAAVKALNNRVTVAYAT
jgi:hypothetical protein